MKTAWVFLAVLVATAGNAATPLPREESQPLKKAQQIAPLDPEQKALIEAQQWLKSLRYELTLDGVKALKKLRLQMYGTINGVSTQTLISNDNLRHLKVLRNLEELALPTWTNDDGISNVAGLIRLKVLNVPTAKLTNAAMSHLKNLAAMESLVLTGANIDDAGVSQLAGMSNLQILNLSNSGITDAGMDHVGKLASLQMLFLARTAITDASIPQLVKLKGLRRLDIVGTGITAAGREKIRATIPRIEIN